MSISWITLLRHMPWKQVIEHAPAAVESASKLWRKVRKPAAEPEETPPPAGEPPTLETLHQRLASLEASHREYAKQMHEVSELIQTLAEQSAQLMTKLEAQRIFQRRLFYLAASGWLLAVSVLLVVLLR